MDKDVSDFLLLLMLLSLLLAIVFCCDDNYFWYFGVIQAGRKFCDSLILSTPSVFILGALIIRLYDWCKGNK